jgi:hypothetical protein
MFWVGSWEILESRFKKCVIDVLVTPTQSYRAASSDGHEIIVDVSFLEIYCLREVS